MKLSDFDYHLPTGLIAQRPKRPRHDSRLLVLDKKTGQIGHDFFFNLLKYLKPSDVLVFNDSKVIPARLFGWKETGGKIQLLLTRDLGAGRWQAVLGGFKEKELGKEIIFEEPSAFPLPKEKPLCAQPEKFLGDGLWEIRFNLAGTALKKKINELGQTPLPPYIKQEADLRQYQTLYAKNEGSAAAPTAGLHFSGKILSDLKKRNIQTEFVTLHVGLGTFLPVKTENLEEHKMHSEAAQIDEATARRLNEYKKEGRRIIAVGTTSARTLEGFADEKGLIQSGLKELDIFITPGYEFKVVRGLITNFHLPKSTLLMLICALAGREKVFKAYNQAIQKNYRFYSFGDAMLIL